MSRLQATAAGSDLAPMASHKIGDKAEILHPNSFLATAGHGSLEEYD